MSATLEFKFSAVPRSQFGSAVARRLRREQKVPAIVYGAHQEPQAVSLEHKEVIKAVGHEEVFTQILTLEVDGKSEQVVIKDIERHHTKPIINHIDFLRINANEKITLHVPIHFVGEENCPGVKEGGVVSHLVQDIEITCLPKDLPHAIEMNIASLEIDHAMHLSDIVLPQGVELTSEITEEHNPTIVSVHHPRVEAEPEEAAVGADKEGEDAADKADDAEKTAVDDNAEGGKKQES